MTKICSLNLVKLKVVVKEILTQHKNMHSSTTTAETSENEFLFVSISSFISFGVCIYAQYFLKQWEIKLETENI